MDNISDASFHLMSHILTSLEMIWINERLIWIKNLAIKATTGGL